MSNNSRIAKNTLFLYFRMFLLLFLGLYISRINLKVLGIEDFGIYNVVGGVVVLFLFFTNALTAGVQRYINYYLGTKDEGALKKIFSQSMRAFIVLALGIFVLSESVGLLLFEKYLIIPNGRMNAARLIYQFSVFSSLIMILRIPFNAVIIAYEHMSFFAYLSILEGVLKLVFVMLLQYVFVDKLIFFGAFQLLIPIIMLVVYFIYCNKNFKIINFKKYEDKTELKGMISFSSWNIIGSAASLFCNQGLNVIVNRFFGVGINAAMGIANQVNNAIYGFLSNFQTAFNPQIVKSYAQNDKEYLYGFIIKTSKYSFFLIYFIVLPFVVNIDFVLHIWLTDVPRYSNIFIVQLCIFTLIDSLSGPLWMVAEAEGNIRTYQLVSGISGLLVVPVAYLLYLLGLPPVIGLVVHNIQLIAFSIWRLFYLYKRIAFPSVLYFKQVYLRLLIIVPVSAILVYLIHGIIKNSIADFFVSCISSCIILGLLYLTIGITKNERIVLINFLKRKIKN